MLWKRVNGLELSQGLALSSSTPAILQPTLPPFCKQSKWVVVSFLLVCLLFISNLKPPVLAPLPAVTGKHATTYNQSVPMLTPSSPPSMHRAHINTLAYSKYLSLFQWHKTLSNCAHFGRTLLLPTLKIVSLHIPNRYTNWILNQFFK